MTNIFNDNFKRDPFETYEEFKARINKLDLILAGEAILIKENYNIITGKFLLKINWNEDFVDSPFTSYEYYLILDRDHARNLYNLGSIYPIYIKLTSTFEIIYIDKFVLKSNEMILIDRIENENKIIQIKEGDIITIENIIEKNEKFIDRCKQENRDFSATEKVNDKCRNELLKITTPFRIL